MAKFIAWAGGGVFLASLAYLVYFFAVVLGSPAGASGHAAVVAALLNTVGFSVFAAHHSLFARTGVKRWLARRVRPVLERTLYVWIASALLVAVCLAWQPLGGILYSVEGAARWLLHAVQLAGVALTARATQAIDGLSLAGIRQVIGSDEPREETISRAGPFGLVRHPIYLGWVLMVGAAPTMTANRVLFAVLSVSYLILAIPWEERSLVAAHGDRYRVYQQTVRWRLVPGVW